MLIREGQLLKEYLIGTGGWAYFRLPRLRPLIAYSRIFNFVEVNSTFYEIPSVVEAGTWRKMAPADFQFSVRAHRTITHTHKLKPNPEVFEAFEKMKRICNALNAEILHLQASPLFEVNESSVQNLRQLLASLSLGDLRLALEIRGTSKSSGLDCRLQRLMEDNNMIHSVDLSKDEEPAFDSDIVYSRLFGKGKHNIYQPTDGELAEIDQKAANTKSEKIVMSFHFVKMYKDAVRLKTYKQTGKFPSITNSIGIDSLEEVLSEDAKFPATKLQLMQNQGWKLFDLSDTDRIHVAEALKELPEQTYRSRAEVVEKVGKIMR